MKQNSDQINQQDDWQDCPPGAVQELADRLRQRRRHQQLTKVSQIGGAAVVLLAVGIWFAFGNHQPVLAGMTCSEVIEQAEDYVAGRLQAAVNGRIEEHLSHCEVCRERIAEMKSRFETPDVSPPIPDETRRQDDQRSVRSPLASIPSLRLIANR